MLDSGGVPGKCGGEGIEVVGVMGPMTRWPDIRCLVTDAGWTDACDVGMSGLTDAELDVTVFWWTMTDVLMTVCGMWMSVVW